MSEPELPQPPADPNLRASDADRERLVDELEEHAVAGRLTTEEFEERAGEAYAATTTGQLAALQRDLPLSERRVALGQRERRTQLTKRMLQETGGSAALFVVCAAIWVASGASGQFWPVWVLIVVVLSLARNGWALYGPNPDLDAVEADLDARRERQRVNQTQHASRRDLHQARRERRLDR
jgi:Domain of unknown function (DUF1707)